MNTPTDHADLEVRGLERYAPPRKVSRVLLLLLATSAWFVFQAVLQNPGWFWLQSLSPDHLRTAAIAATLGWTNLLSFFVLLDMSVFISHSKHRRIAHYSNRHPYMSWRWLYDNASFKHWAALVAVIGVAASIGYFYGKA
jgi:hypothetical protein